MERKSLLLIGILAFFSLLLSCQKEISFDLSLPSIGRLQCSNFLLSGEYSQHNAMTPDHSLSMKIRVSRRGTYHVESLGIENGIKFSADGVFEEDGLQDVKLFASGIPEYSDTFTYRIVYNDDTCEVPVYFKPDRQVVSAEMTFLGYPTICLIDTARDINGIYMVGLAMNSSNTITVHANVTTRGTYFIQTPVINGVSFSAQGQVDTTGPVDIVLQASGTPIAVDNGGGPFYYPVTVGGISCSISMTFRPSVPSLSKIDVVCNPNLIAVGNYVQGQLTRRATHYIKIPVNYTPASTTGTYSITTSEINGLIFSGTGILNPTRNDSILLTASGTPTNGNPNPYTYTFTYPTGNGQTSSCSFTVLVTGNYITANINGSFTTFNVQPDATISASVGTTSLEIKGKSNSLSPYPSINILLTLGIGASFTSGTFNVNNVVVQGGDLSCNYNQSNIVAYGSRSVSGTTQANPFTLEVSGNTTRINGRFYGNIYLNSQVGQQPVIIDNGVFSLPLP